MNKDAVFQKLEQQLQRLRSDAQQFDKSKWFEKNRFMQSKHGLFERHVFQSKSMLLEDYVDEVAHHIDRLLKQHQYQPSARHQFEHAFNHIAEQIEAIIKVLKATDVWAKENTPTAKAKRYKKAIERIVKPTSDLYQELAQNHEYERRLEEMLRQSQDKLARADGAKSTELNNEVLVLQARLGRCRKAISACEEKIMMAENRSRS